MTNAYEAKLVANQLARAMLEGSRDLATVPALLFRVMQEHLWELIPDEATGEVPRSFPEYVEKPYPSGLGSTRKQLDGICAGKEWTYVREKIDEEYGDRSQHRRPRGTSEALALRRLHKDRPDLHARVLADPHYSANAAMIEAGFRPKTFTVRADNPDKIAATLRRNLDPETFAEVQRLLT